MPFYKAITVLLTLSVMLTPGLIAAADIPADLNEGQRLIFAGDHLQQIPEDGTVIYRFTRRSTGQPDKQDEVRMTVTKVRDDGRRNLSFEFLSGPDRLPFPPAEGYRGNPVAIQFLERDIRDMAQATGGSVAYLRNRIRKAFRDPTIRGNRAIVDGMELDMVEVSVMPFKADPNVAEFDGYADKQYRFVYAEQIAGGLVSVQTRMSSESGAVLEEELHYIGTTVAN